MQVSPTPLRTKASEAKPGLLSRHKRLRWLVIFVLFFAAVSVRMYHIDSTTAEFYEDRQYYSSWGARCMYYSSLDSIPDWQKDIIEAYRSMNPWPDNSRMTVPLPTIEGIARLLYSLAGGEHMWLPRAFSALAWVIGGVFLYLLAKRLMSKEAALLATGFYLLLPAGITGSRSFQVDPLMVAATICSIYAIFLHDEKPTLRRTLIAGAVAAVAILIRPTCAFMILGAFIALSLRGQGLRRAIVNPHSWLFGVIAVLPMAALIILDKLVTGAAAVGFFAEASVQPERLLLWSFYTNWALYLRMVIGSWELPYLVDSVSAGTITLATAAIGATMLRSRHALALIIGLCCGYLAFCLVFTFLSEYHMYHHLMIVPVIALCLGPIAERILRWGYDSVADIIRSRWVSRVAVGGILLLFAAFQVARVAFNTPTVAEMGREREVVAQTVGETIDHSPNVIVLSPGRGLDATYHGWFFGRSWPRQGWEPALGSEDLVEVKARLHNMCQDWQPTYFVITDMADFDRQPALRQFLFATYPIVAQTDTYLIFDLRESVPSPSEPLGEQIGIG